MPALKVSRLFANIFRRNSVHDLVPLKGNQSPKIVPMAPVSCDQYIDSCESILEQSLIETLNEFADSVNKLAIEVRKEGDLLLTLGVSDEDVMKASNLAQLALSCVNLGRGRDLKGDCTRSSFSERKINVVTGMALTKEAQRLLSEAKKHNAKSINKAVARHEQILNSINTLNLTKV